MTFGSISYPKIIFIQATAPSNTTQGLLWVDTDDNKLYVANGSSYDDISTTATAYLISDKLVLSHDAVASMVGLTYVKQKTITLAMPTGTDTIRIKFDLKSGGWGTGFGRIYKNGVAVGTERSTNSSTYATHSEDLEFADGDTLELWCKTSNFNPPTNPDAFVKDFRVYGSGLINANITGANT